MNLQEKLAEIEKKTSQRDKKNIHFKSLQNFVYHYGEVKKEKTHVTKLLEEYINLIEAKNYHLTNEESKAAYNLFVYQLGIKYYRRYLGFSSGVTFDLIVLFFALPNIFIWVFFQSYILSLIILCLTTFYWVKYFVKLYKKKIYAYKY